MKVEIITGKYKPFGSDEWVRTGQQIDLPDGEAIAAIQANVAKEVVENPSAASSPPAMPEPVPTDSRRGRPSKSEE